MPIKGRPSKLSNAQWEEIGRRLLAGGITRTALAKEYGVSAGRITQRFSKDVAKVKYAAKQIVKAEEAIAILNITERVAAFSLVDDLKAVSKHLASAAKYGAMTAHRLSEMAHTHTEVIDPAANLAVNLGPLQNVVALTRGANEASNIGVNLLRANKEAVDELNHAPVAPDVDLSKLSDKELEDYITLREKVQSG
jgi:isocitrate lyase